jgi:hypothetical protein
MGAWGILAFDNDEACDWAYDLEKVRDLSLVEEAFASVAGPAEYLDAHDACNALAACEVLAGLRGNPGYRNSYTEAVDAWVDLHPMQPSANLLARADVVIERVLGDNSELRDLWDESEALGIQWRKSVEDLRNRLRA